MSIRISPQALTGVIWPKKPFMHPDGLLVEAGFELSSTVFTCVAFTPDDPLRFCASDSTGAVHLFQLKKNRISTVARCSAAVSSVVFGKDRSTIHISCGMTVSTVNIDACRVDSKVKSPHKNNIVALTSPNLMAGDGSSPGVGGVYATMFGSMSSDSLTLWTSSSGTGTVAGSGVAELSTPLPDCRVETRGKFTSISMSTTHVYAIDATEQTVSCFSTKRLALVARVSLQPHVPYTLSLAATFLAVGARNSPNLLLLKPVSLDGISRVVIPSQPDSPSTLHVSTVAAADPTGRLVGCQLSDGRVWFVSTQTYGATFSLTPSAGDVPLQLSLAAEEYGVALSAGTLKVYHLPAAKQYFDRTHSKKKTAALSESVASATPKPFLKTSNEAEEVVPDRDPHVEAGYGAGPTDQVNMTAGGQTHKGIARSVLSCEKSSRRSGGAAGEGGQRDLAWVRVNLIDRTRELKALATEAQPKLLSDAIKTSFIPAAPSSDGAASGQGSGAPGKAPAKVSTVKKPASASGAAGGNQVPNKVISDGGVPGVSLRALLDDDSKVLNLEKLRVILMKYGCYPDRYRSLIWRFLLQLPEKTLIAPHFANLTSKGLHPGVHAMMKHYPLPDSKQKIHLERALSALAYHAPVFSVVDWLPCIVFPFVKAFGADTQSAVEVCISFFLNWGQEFFVYYPHPPVQISSYISHLLKAEDPQLWQHFQEIACSPEDYVFSVLQPVFSEVLTRNEWLQLMDHAFSNEPLWLFLFHVRWLCEIRELLLSIQDHAELVALLHRTIPCDFNRIIQQTYRLHGRCLRNELTEPYHDLITFDETGYPTTIVANDAVITSKVRELEKIEDHEKEVVAMKSRTQMIEKQLAQAAMLEDAYISKQKALVAAKFDASNSLWQQQVALEKERQHLRDIEQTSRLHAVQEQLRSAQRLQAVQDEIRAANLTIKDAEVDRQRESMKWDFADRMTHQEMTRIEHAAKSKLSTVLNVAKEETLAERDLRQALEDNRGLQLADYVGPDSQNLSAVSNGQENRHHHATGMAAAATGPPEPSAVPPVPQAAIPVATTRSGSSQGLSPSQSPETQQAQTLAQPQTSRVATAQAVRGNSPPTATTSQPTSSSPSHREGSSTTDTSAPPSSANSDPIAYYRRLQQQVREKVQEAHAEQRAALSTLNSSYARKLMADVGHSATSGSTTERAAEGDTFSGEEAQGDVSGTTVTEGDLSDHEEHEVVEEGSRHGIPRRGQDRESANSSTDASSIHHAITRPQPVAFFRIPPSEAETHSTE